MARRGNHRSMIGTRQHAALALALVLFGAWLAACSSTTTATTDEGALPTNTKATPRPQGTQAATATCSLELLKAGVADKYPDATIQNNFCSLTFAIATIYPKDGPKKGIVGFYGAGVNTWTLLKEAAPDSDLAAEAPPDFPANLIDNWRNQYVDPTKPTTTVTTAKNNNTGGNCSGEGANYQCETTTTPPPSTTSTTTNGKGTSTTGKASSTTTAAARVGQ